MKQKTLAILFLLFIAVAPREQLAAQNPWKKVTFTVTDAVTGEPVEGAEVMFKAMFIKARKLTDPEGKAVFEIPLTTESLNMNYTVTCPAGKKTYRPFSGSVALVSSKDVYDCQAPVQPDTRTVSFKVSDDKRQPLPDATVTLNDDNGQIAKARTDAGGTANFDVQPDAQFKNPTITVAKEGFNNYTVPVEINNKTSQVSVVAPFATNTIVVGSEPEKPKEKPGLPGPTVNVDQTSMPPDYFSSVKPEITWGPYTPGCDTDPVAGVPLYTSLAVADEKSLLEHIGSECLGAAGEAVNALADLTENIVTMNLKLNAAWTQAFPNSNQKQPAKVPTLPDSLKLRPDDALKLATAVKESAYKTRELFEKMTKIAAGPELFAIECIWEGFRNYIIPDPLLTLKKSTEAFSKARSGMKEKMEAMNKKAESKEPLTISDLDLYTNWIEITENVEKTCSGLSLIYSYICDPVTILPYETQVNLSVSTAEKMMGTVMSDCQIRELDRQIKQGIAAGQAMVTAARKRTAQMKKGERRMIAEITDYVNKNFSPENRGWLNFKPNDYRLQQLPTIAYNDFVRYHNGAIDAEYEAKRLEGPLKKLGELCAKIQPMAATLNERVKKYEEIYAKGITALEACKLDDALNYVKQLQAIENSGCSHFFPKPFGITKSEELSTKISDIKKSGKCAEVIPGAYVLTKKVIITSNEYRKIDTRSLQIFDYKDKSLKISFTLLTPIPSVLVPGTNIQIDISGTCFEEKTSFFFHPYLYLKDDKTPYNHSYVPGNSKPDVGFHPFDKLFIASATGTMVLMIPKEGSNEIIIYLSINWSEEGSVYEWAEYYYEKK